MINRILLALIVGIAFLAGWIALNRIPIKVIGQPSVTGFIQSKLEQPFFENLAQKTGLPIEVTYLPNDALGFKDTHQLTMLRDGQLDLVSLRFLQNASAEPTLLGIDPWGLTTDFTTARAVVNAYAPVLDQRLQSHFNAKLLGIWPFGPQIFFCRQPVRHLADIEGLRVRVGNENFARLISEFGATPVVLPFEDVANALATGMADCAITSAGSGHFAGWAEHSTHLFTLGLQMGLNGYVINLKLWNRLSKTDRAKLEAAFNDHVETIWRHAESVHLNAISCITGGKCQEGKSVQLIKTEPDDSDYQRLYAAFHKTTLHDWAARCDRVHPGCAEDWLSRIEPILPIRTRQTDIQ